MFKIWNFSLVEGFNTAVENLGGIGIFRNINFNKNHMDYWFDTH